MRQRPAAISMITSVIFVTLFTTILAHPVQAQTDNLATPPASARPNDEVIRHPLLDVERSVEVGQSLIYSNYYVSRSSYAAIKLQATAEDRPNPPGTTRVNGGTLGIWPVRDEGNYDGKFYRDLSATYLMLGAAVPAEAGIFVPNDKSKATVVYHYRPGGMFGLGKGYTFGTIPIAVPEETIVTTEKITQDSLRRELVYAGIMQNVLTLLYREFKGDFARPAFSQEIKYDLSQGTTIGYKGARFEVIKATNVDLTYKVMRYLE